jgi:hypothetical protein
MDPNLLHIATAFGLAASAGLNTTLPLVIVGLLARVGLLTLAPPYDALAGELALGGLLLLALIEIVGDAVPGVDSTVHLLQWPLAAAAGAILFASQTTAITWVSPEVTIVVGLLIAGCIHAVRAATRPLVTAVTCGLANAIVSFLENGMAIVMAATSLLAPVVGVGIAASVAGFGCVALIRAVQRLR